MTLKDEVGRVKRYFRRARRERVFAVFRSVL